MDLQGICDHLLIFELFTQKSDDSLRGHQLATYLPLGLTEKTSETPLTPTVG